MRVAVAVALAQVTGAEGVRRNVDQQSLDVVPGQPARQDAGAEGDAQVRVQILPRGPSAQRLQQLDDERGSRRAADEQNVVQRGAGDPRVSQRLGGTFERLLQERPNHRLVHAAGDLHLEVQRPPVHDHERFFAHRRVGLGAELPLGRLGGEPEPRIPAGVGALKVHAVLAAEHLQKVVHQLLVEIVAAKMIVPVAGKDLGHIAIDADDRDVKRAAAQVIDHHGLADVACEAVGQTGGRRLVDHPDDLQPRQRHGVARRGALGVGEVRGDGDHRLTDRAPQASLGPGGQLAQDQRRDLQAARRFDRRA